MKKIYVGYLPFSATEAQVRTLFDKHGTVQSVALVNDRETGRFRGFGFVEIADEGLAPALKALDGYEMDGRALITSVGDVGVGDLRVDDLGRGGGRGVVGRGGLLTGAAAGDYNGGVGGHQDGPDRGRP